MSKHIGIPIKARARTRPPGPYRSPHEHVHGDPRSNLPCASSPPHPSRAAEHRTSPPLRAVQVLHDAEGHTVTVEIKNGEVYRGKLDEAEDNMNVHLSNVTKTMADGRVQVLSNCFLRGSQVRFMVLPDILKNAPFFKKIDTKANKSANKSASRAKQAATARASGRPTPGMPAPKGQKRDAGGRNPSFN